MTLAAPFIRNTVCLKVHGFHDEAFSSDGTPISPAMLLQRQSDGTVVHHSVASGRNERIFAKEDALQGKWFNDTYASGDLVSYIQAMQGDMILAMVPANAPAIVNGAAVVSNGDGTVVGVGSTGSMLLYSNTAPSTAVSNTSSATLFDKNYTIPANFLAVGDVIHIRAEAIVTAVNSTNTFLFTVKIGTTTIVATAAANPTANDVALFDITIVIRTIGASGTFVAEGTQYQGTPASATALGFILASTALDTTVTKQIGVFVTESVANTGNSARLDILEIELSRAAIPLSIVGFADVSFDNSANSAVGYIPIRTA